MGKAKQQRSHQTFERIIKATERLLEKQLFDEITVAAIVREAKATVGSFYNLFDDKTALLPHLYQNHCKQLLERYEAIRMHGLSNNKSLREVVSLIVKAIVELNQDQRGLLRALVLRAHTKSKGPSKASNELLKVLPGLADLVASKREEINHPRPQIAARLGLLAVLATVRETLLYPDTSAQSLKINEKNLVTELTRMWLSYLVNQT